MSAGAMPTVREILSAPDRDSFRMMAMRILDARPRLGGDWAVLARGAEMLDEIALADALVSAWQEECGVNTETLDAQCMLLSRTGRPAAALEILRSMERTAENSFALAFHEGRMLLEMGDAEGAADAYRRALDDNGRSGLAWLGLVNTGKETAEDADRLAAMAPTIDTLSIPEQAAYRNALAQVHHRNGRHEEAFASFLRSAQLVKAHLRARPLPFPQLPDGAATPISSAVAPGDVPIIVTGMPRSGTTLVESLLVAHSKVGEGSELGLFGRLELELARTGETPADLDREKRKTLAGTYVRLARERIGGKKRYIDKSVLNFLHLGMVEALFPDAPIVWLRRDPADNGWSIFSTYLATIDWGWDFGDIGEVFALEEQLHQFWSERMGDRLLTVRYEELVSDPATWSRRITEHVGLQFEEGQLDAHLTPRVVATASAAQVREPLDARGVGVSAPYRDRMGSLFEAIGRERS